MLPILLLYIKFKPLSILSLSWYIVLLHKSKSPRMILSIAVLIYYY